MSFEERKQMNETLLASNKASEDKLSTHPLINKLLNDGYYLKVWCDRYSAGIRIALGREYSQEFESVCQLTDSADMEAGGLSEYLFNTGSWLPFECSETVQESLDALEAKLALFPQDQISRSSHWAEQYDIALTKILDSADGGYGIASAIDSGRLPRNPFKLSE